MKPSLFLFIHLLIISHIAIGQSITLVPTNPVNPTKGTLNYDNAANLLRYWNGTAWIPLTNAAAGTGWAASGKNINNANTGNVGIGTNTPKAPFNVSLGKTVLFGTDTSGIGGKFIWYPDKAALRTGYAGSTEFDKANVGYYSVALGSYVSASGNYSTAFGQSTTASGLYSTATGLSNTASNTATTAMGYDAHASGAFSTAIGQAVTASGHGSTAMGLNASTNNYDRSFCIAGSMTPTLNSSVNQMMMRFDNYTFWVTSVNYAYLTPSSNGWAYISDKNKKENFQELNGETVLKKISAIPFYSWNFKAKDTRQYRHYGIMAQDFYQAFGKDNYGAIGNDTTVSPLDLLGVAYSGIKALEKRTEVLQAQNQYLAEEIAALKAMLRPKHRKYAFRKSKEPENLIVKQ
jgi:hypothetical protein